MGKGQNLGEFEQVTLLAIARLGDGVNGAAIHREIHETTGRDVSPASVYVTLSRLERKGWVSSDVEEGGPDRTRPRRSFSVTDAGVVELQTARRVLARLWEGIPFDPLHRSD